MPQPHRQDLGTGAHVPAFGHEPPPHHPIPGVGTVEAPMHARHPDPLVYQAPAPGPQPGSRYPGYGGAPGYAPEPGIARLPGPGNGSWAGAPEPAPGTRLAPTFGHDSGHTGGRRRRGGRRGLVVAALAALLVAAGAAAWILLGGEGSDDGTSVTAAPKDAAGTVTAFLTGVRDRDYTSAAAHVCAQQNVGPEQLAAVFDQQFGKMGMESFRIEDGGGDPDGPQARVTYVITVAGGKSLSFQATVTRSANGWCISDNKQLS